jgi:hypothetical protein
MFTWSGGVFIEYLVYFLDAYRRQGEYVLQQDQGKNVSSLTLMSKGEKGSSSNVSGTESSRMQRSSGAESRVRAESNECRGAESRVRIHMGACVAINAKGGDCWQILNRQRMRVGKY